MSLRKIQGYAPFRNTYRKDDEKRCILCLLLRASRTALVIFGSQSIVCAYTMSPVEEAAPGFKTSSRTRRPLKLCGAATDGKIYLG